MQKSKSMKPATEAGILLCSLASSGTVQPKGDWHVSGSILLPPLERCAMRLQPRYLWTLFTVLCLAVGAAAAGRPAAAQQNCTDTPCKILLPVVRVAPVEPLLIEPASGAQLITLAP